GGVLGDHLGLGHPQGGEEARSGVLADVEGDRVVGQAQGPGDEGGAGDGGVLLPHGGEVGGDLLGQGRGLVLEAGRGADGGQDVLPGGGVVRGQRADRGRDPAQLLVLLLGEAGVGGDDQVRHGGGGPAPRGAVRPAGGRGRPRRRARRPPGRTPSS